MVRDRGHISQGQKRREFLGMLSNEQKMRDDIDFLKQQFDRMRTFATADVTQLVSGWLPMKDSWVYSSYSSTTKIAVFTSDMEDMRDVYSAGQRVRFEQPTDGAKYGIIHLVQAASIAVFMHDDYDVDAEAIELPYYSPVYAPAGFDLDADKWMIEWIAPGGEDEGSGLGSAQQMGTADLLIGVGNWDFTAEAEMEMRFSSGSLLDVNVGVSTSKTSYLYGYMKARFRLTGVGSVDHHAWNFEARLTLTAADNFYIISHGSGPLTQLDLRANSYMRAYSAHI